MPYDIVLGRSEEERQKLGNKIAVFLGKHYVKMGAVTSLSQNVFLDVNNAHVVFICGKRGTGKSYSIGVIAEGIHALPDEIRSRLSVIILDTMGIYWTMKYPNHKDEKLLNEWGFEGNGVPVKIYTPQGFFKQFREQGIPADVPFAINPAELNPEDWWLTFGLNPNEPLAVFIERKILELKEVMHDFDIPDIVEHIRGDQKEDVHVKNAAENRFLGVAQWGIFSRKATLMKDIAKGGQISVLDLSAYALMPNGWNIKCLVMGLVSQKLFLERLAARKVEEFKNIYSAVHYIVEEESLMGEESPMVWILIDEAHEFLPNKGKTAASDALITLLREGRQPGISLVLATQQPGKIHTDVMTQSDVIIAHRITAKIDTDALGALLQTYLRQGLDKELNILPHIVGSALAMDDVNERIYPIKVRPRFSWHGGSAPVVQPERKELFEI